MKNRKIQGRDIGILAYAYLLFPLLIFILGYCKWFYAFPICAVLLVSFKMVTKAIDLDDIGKIEKKECRTLMYALLIIVVWVIISGIGNLVPQNTDQIYRNSIFELLVKYEWPVRMEIETGSGSLNRVLCYYIGFWMPSALIGKIFGLHAGYVAQIIWAVLGLYLCYLLLCVILKKIRLWPLFAFIFFGGLDYIGTLLMSKGSVFKGAYEFWAGVVVYTGTGGQLAYVFNQSLPAWIATLLLLTEKNRKNCVFLLGSLFLSSIFPFMGICLIVLYQFIEMLIKNKKEVVTEFFTFQNIFGGGAAGILTFLYYQANTVMNITSQRLKESVNSGGALVGEILSQNEVVELSGVFAPTAFISLGNKNVSVEGVTGIIERWISPAESYYNLFTNVYETSYIVILLRIILFVILEIGIFYISIYRENRKNGLYYYSGIVLSLLPFLVFLAPLKSVRGDMIMRISVPFLIILFVMILKKLDSIDSKKERNYWIILFLISCFATVTIWRNTAFDIIKGVERQNIEEEILMQGGNFSGEDTGFFFEVLCKEKK